MLVFFYTPVHLWILWFHSLLIWSLSLFMFSLPAVVQSSHYGFRVCGGSNSIYLGWKGVFLVEEKWKYIILSGIKTFPIGAIKHPPSNSGSGDAQLPSATPAGKPCKHRIVAEVRENCSHFHNQPLSLPFFSLSSLFSLLEGSLIYHILNAEETASWSIFPTFFILILHQINL